MTPLDSGEFQPPAPNRPATKRRLRVSVPLDEVSRLLGLRPGHHVVAFDHANDPLGIVAIVEGPDFPESPIDSHSPFGMLHVTIEPGGQVHRELSWSFE